jgi:hypothetical protein
MLIAFMFFSLFTSVGLQQKEKIDDFAKIKTELVAIKVCLSPETYGRKQNQCLDILHIISKQLDIIPKNLSALAIDWGIAQSFFRLEDVKEHPELSEVIFKWIDLEEYVKEDISNLKGTKENIAKVENLLVRSFSIN